MNVNEYKLFEGKLKLMKLILENEPINSAELKKITKNNLGWKKSSTFPFIKKLSERNFVKNDKNTITALVPYNEIKTCKNKNTLKYLFKKLFPIFSYTFLENRQLYNSETKIIKNIMKIEKKLKKDANKL